VDEITGSPQLKIFVSYSSQDKAICDQVVTALRGAGADVWYDEHDLGAGQLLEEMQRELQTRRVFVVLLSKNAFASPWVRRETTWAFNLASREPNRLILPITVGAIEPSDFNGAWLFLEEFKRVEAPGLPPHPTAEMISQTLRLLALTAKGETPVTVTPQPAERLNELLTQGRALQAQQKHAKALLFFERAALLDPNSFDAWVNLGNTLSQLKRYAEALPAHERATTLDPTSSPAWNNNGRALIELKRYEEGLAACEQALALDPTNAAAWNGKASALHLLGRDSEALPAVERSLDLDPENVNTLDTKGHVLLGLHQYGDAVDAFDRAVTLDPTIRESWKGKATALRALGRTAATKAKEAAGEAEAAATEAKNAATLAEQAAERMLDLLGNYTVAQDLVEQAKQAQGAAAFAMATKAIEEIVATQLTQSGNALQALQDARKEAKAVEQAAREAEALATKAEEKAAEAAKWAEEARQKATGRAQIAAHEADQARQSARRIGLAARDARVTSSPKQMIQDVFQALDAALNTEREAQETEQKAKQAGAAAGEVANLQP
jgi:tetratricopeptide (TPR) repeat protein